MIVQFCVSSCKTAFECVRAHPVRPPIRYRLGNQKKMSQTLRVTKTPDIINSFINSFRFQILATIKDISCNMIDGDQ